MEINDTMQNLKQQFNSRKIIDELKQKQAITDVLIHRILYSKRLLVDHVEALEQCLYYLQEQSSISPDTTDCRNIKNSSTNEIFTTRNTCILLGSTLLEELIKPKSLRFMLVPSIILSGGFGVMYLVKNIFFCRNKMVERKLVQLIKTIDEFGNCIRRNMTYFQEIIIMKQKKELIESRQIEHAWDCITAAKEVTEILYDATRKLETDYVLPVKYNLYYAPMEELRECEYFKNNVTDYTPKHIKDFYNIFAYVQSQFLLRLALAILIKPSISKLNVELEKIDCLIRQLVNEEEQHFKNLSIEMHKMKQLELDELNSAKALKQRSSPIAVLQNSSLKLNACMMAVANECQSLDLTLQQLTETEAENKDNGQQLVAVANNMRTIENALSNCFEDFQRLMLVYNKFLNSKMNNNVEQNGNDLSKNEQNEFPESILRVEITQNPNETQKHDDFYAYMYDENDANNGQLLAQKATPELEILNFEKRITKGKFKPVLKQLKDRIDPIRQSMLEKEREILTAKGINVDNLFGQIDKAEEELAKAKQTKRQEKGNRFMKREIQSDDGSQTSDDNSDDSVDSADLEFEQRNKHLKGLDNFAEMRNFLAQKEAINLFKLATSPTVMPKIAGEEELLESEC